MKFYSNVAVKDLPHTNHLYTLNTESFSIEVEPTDRARYEAHAETAALGALTLARIVTNGAVVSRKNEEFIDPGHRRFSLVYVVAGELAISHRLGMNMLKPGEFTLMDNSHPRKMFVYDSCTLFLISIPCQVLQRYIPSPEAIEGLTLQARGSDNVEPLFEPLLALWEQLKLGSLREFAPSISEKFLSRVAQFYTRHFPALSSAAVRRITEAKQLIEAQLGNPDLSVEHVATCMGVSSRYLRELFHGSEKLSHYILRRRLEESACLLHSALEQTNSITAIAFRCGFNSPAHFSRAFHKHFGMTPSVYRRQSLSAN
jgi:AraC family transcriptional activator of tynA and feaB